jgi:hypothetical protein
MLIFFLSKLPQHTENSLLLESMAKFHSSLSHTLFIKISIDHRKALKMIVLRAPKPEFTFGLLEYNIYFRFTRKYFVGPVCPIPWGTVTVFCLWVVIGGIGGLMGLDGLVLG